MDQPPNDWDKRQIRRGASFLQSSWWGGFQAQTGARPFFLDGDSWSCLLFQKKNKAGTYFFSPYGPTADSAKGLNEAISSITDFGSQHGAAWLSLEPMSQNLPAPEIREIIQAHRAQPAARHREPDLTRVVDLSPSAEDQLARISQSTRSLIRKNNREKSIGFRTSSDPGEIRIFTRMLKQVAGRNSVNFFSDEYFAKQAQILMPVGAMRLELALAGNRPIAAAVFHDYGQRCTYTYAASLPEARQTSASALLLWHSMQNAKARGMDKMDLYGIAPPDSDSGHPWSGFTSFKQKFGGEVVQLAGTWDIGLSPRYKAYRAAHKARRLIKRH